MKYVQEAGAKGGGGGAIPVATGTEAPVPGSGFASAESSLDTSPVKIPLARGSNELGERRRMSHEVCAGLLHRPRGVFKSSNLV